MIDCPVTPWDAAGQQMRVFFPDEQSPSPCAADRYEFPKPPSSRAEAIIAFPQHTASNGAKSMTFTLNAAMLQPIVALLAGILILIIPRILNFIIAIYLIFVGVTGLWPHLLSALPH